MSSAAAVGESVVVAISDDDGQTWPRHVVAMRDPEPAGLLRAEARAVARRARTLRGMDRRTGELADRCAHYAISEDNGLTWSAPQATHVMGQTMIPLPLDDRRLLVVYTRRYGRQGILEQTVDFARERWDVTWEGLLHDPGTECDRHAHPDGLRTWTPSPLDFPPRSDCRMALSWPPGGPSPALTAKDAGLAWPLVIQCLMP
jgi:hypothetical protein